MAIHIHVHDSGTPEGARKAAQTRRMHGGPQMVQNTKQIARAAQLHEKVSGLSKRDRTKFEQPKVPISRTELTGARREATATSRQGARSELQALQAKHKAGTISGAEHARMMKLRQVYGG
jgi:hypothetical protein